MRRVCLFLIALGVVGLVTSEELCAQNSPVYFPYVVNDGKTTTELLFTNTTSRDASLTLTGYTEDGTAIEGPAVVAPAHSQVVVSSFTGLSGWVLAQSSVAGVVGNVRVRSADGTAQDIAEPAQPNTTIVLPFVAQTGGASTEISIVNPSLYITRVSLEVRNAGGTTIATVDRQVPPFGSFRGSLSDVFGGERNYDDASHVIARSVPANIFSQEVNIVGFEVVRNFSRADSSLDKILGRTDWAALSAVPATGTGSSLTFPHVIRGMDRFSLIGLVNTGSTDQSVTLTYSIANSSTVLNSGPVLIRANGSLRQTVVDLFGPASANGDHGVLRVTGANAVRGFLATGSSSGSSIAAAPAQVNGQTEFLFPSVERSTTAATGVVLLNDGTARVDVDLFLISPQGATVGRARRSIDPQQRILEGVESLFLEALTLPGGYIFVGSTGAIFGHAESGVVSKTYSLLAPQQAPALLPAAQSLFGIRGRITDYSATGTGAAVSGVTVVLSRTGNEDLTTTTDVNGDYLFGNLLPGDYVVKPQQAGRMFSPFNPSVRLDTGSRRVDFVRGLVPTMSGITVVTNDESERRTAGNNPDPYAIFGTGEVSLKIQGTNFAAGQRLFFKQPGSLLNPNGREVFFSFVDSTTLFVRLTLSNPSDLSQLATTGRYELEIAGQAPFTDIRSNALPFFVVPPLPVVTRITPTETYARYEIDSAPLAMRVEGFGFRPGARILFTGPIGFGETEIEIDTTYRSSILLEAFLPAHVLRSGGFYIVRVRNVSLLPELSGEAVNFQVNNLQPQIVSIDPPGPLAIIGHGPLPVALDFKINGSNFFSPGTLGTSVAITQTVPDISPAILPVGGTSQCVPVNGRTVLRVRVFNSAGQPASGVAVTFTAPTIATTGPSGSFAGGAATVTVVSDSFGFAPPLTDNTSTLFSANPFGGSYVIQVTGTVDGFAILAVINMTNLDSEVGCGAAGGGTVEFVSSHQIIVKDYPIFRKGTYSIIVANPSPGGGYSNEIEFVVTDGRDSSIPVITSLNPDTRSASAGAFNLTVLGSNFSSDAWVNFGTVRLNPISRDSNRIIVTVPSILIPAQESAPVTIPVTVTNPGSTLNPGDSGDTGGTSLRAFFTFTR